MPSQELTQIKNELEELLQVTDQLIEKIKKDPFKDHSNKITLNSFTAAELEKIRKNEEVEQNDLINKLRLHREKLDELELQLWNYEDENEKEIKILTGKAQLKMIEVDNAIYKVSSNYYQLVDEIQKVNQQKLSNAFKQSLLPTFPHSLTSNKYANIDFYTNKNKGIQTDAFDLQAILDSGIPCIFRITKNDKSFYLLGTNHAAKLNDLPEYIKIIVHNANLYVGECKLDAPEQLNIISNILARFTQPDRRYLLNFEINLDETEKKALNEKIEKMKVSLLPELAEKFDTIKNVPEQALICMALEYLLNQDLTIVNGIDSQIIGIAKTKFLSKHMGLETSEDVFISTLEASQQDKTFFKNQIKVWLSNKESSQVENLQKINTSVQSYLNNDFRKILNDDRENESLLTRGSTYRNDSFYQEICRILNEVFEPGTRMLVFVGVSHVLEPKNGLLQQFSANDGVSIEQVSDPIGDKSQPRSKFKFP